MFATTLLLALAVAQPPAEAPVEGKKDAAGLPLGFKPATVAGPRAQVA